MVDLTSLIPLALTWLLVLFRLTGIFIFAPMYGSRTIPVRIKVLFSIVLSFYVFAALYWPRGEDAVMRISPVTALNAPLWSLAGVVVAEMMIGLIIGFGANLPVIAMQVAGRVVDQQLGMGLGGVLNPDLDDQSGIVGEFFFIVALALFLILGGHRVLLSTLINTFDHVPLGAFRPDGHMLDLIVGLLASMFELALRVAGPLLCLVFLGTVAMGFIARTVPQINILSIGFPVRILVGMVVITAALSSEVSAFLGVAQRALGDIATFFGG